MLKDFILNFARSGKWAAIGVGLFLFGATWGLNLVWPGNPLDQTFSEVKTGLTTLVTSPTAIQ